MTDTMGGGFKQTMNKIYNWVSSPDPAVIANKIQKNESKVNKDLMLKFFDINNNKNAIIRELDKLKDFYFTQMIIDRFIDDALNPTGNDNTLFKTTVLNSEKNVDEAATKLINDFIDEFNIKRMLLDIAGDLLIYGEHYLRLDVESYDTSTKESKKGIINIHDDVDFANIIPVFRDADVSYYITTNKGALETVQPSKYVYFSLPTNRIKVKLDSVDDKILYFRMGKPIIYPAFGLLKELKLFESMLPIGFINSALKTSLISVGVPSSTKPQDAIEIAKVYEKMINKSMKIDVDGQSSEQVLKTLSEKIGQVKVIPDFGDKGSLETQEISESTDYDDLSEKIVDLRKMALMTIGIPSSIIDEDGLKSDVIKDHIRYSKKLKSIQASLKEGLQRMFIVHLVNNGFDNFIKDDIDIQFLNILNTDDLERLEYTDLMVSMLDNFKSFIEDFEDVDFAKINYAEYIKFLNKQFSGIVGFDLLIPKGDEDEV